MATANGRPIRAVQQKPILFEHIVEHPSEFMGSFAPVKKIHWIYEEKKVDEDENSSTTATATNKLGKMIEKELIYVPALLQMFEGILMFAVDWRNKANFNEMHIAVNPQKNEITIRFNAGIKYFTQDGQSMLKLLFGKTDELLHTNYDQIVPAQKLTNIFSSRFKVQTVTEKAYYECTWEDMTACGKTGCRPDFDQPASTKITFVPNLKKFGMDRITENDTIRIIHRRAFDIAATLPGVAVYFNSKKIPIDNFNDYVQLHGVHYTYTKVNDAWEVAVAKSESGRFRHVSFANSVSTAHGQHIDHVTNAICGKLVKGEAKKTTIRQIKHRLWLFINCKIDHVRPKKYKTKCEIPNAFLSNVKALLKSSNAAEIDTTVTTVKKANAINTAAASAAKTLKLIGRVTKQKAKTKMTDDFVHQVLSVLLPHMEKDETTTEAVATISAALNSNGDRSKAAINESIHNASGNFVNAISTTNVVVRYAIKAPLVVGAKEPAAKPKATKRKASASASTSGSPPKAAKPTKSKRKPTPVDDDDDSSDSIETSMASTSGSPPKVAQRNKPKRQATLNVNYRNDSDEDDDDDENGSTAI